MATTVHESPQIDALNEALERGDAQVGKLRLRKSLCRVGLALAVLVALTLPPLAFSQGCALCYTQAAASGARMIRALRSGIVILIIPPLSMCMAAIALAYRKRNQFNQVDTRVEPGSDW